MLAFHVAPMELRMLDQDRSNWPVFFGVGGACYHAPPVMVGSGANRKSRRLLAAYDRANLHRCGDQQGRVAGTKRFARQRLDCVEEAHPAEDLQRRTTNVDRLPTGPRCWRTFDDYRIETRTIQPIGQNGPCDACPGDENGAHGARPPRRR